MGVLGDDSSINGRVDVRDLFLVPRRLAAETLEESQRVDPLPAGLGDLEEVDLFRGERGQEWVVLVIFDCNPARSGGLLGDVNAEGSFLRRARLQITRNARSRPLEALALK